MHKMDLATAGFSRSTMWDGLAQLLSLVVFDAEAHAHRDIARPLASLSAHLRQDLGLCR